MYICIMEKITPQEKEAIRKYFGMSLEELDLESFKRLRNVLRAKYHPDKFEKFDDETVREMAQERFREIEALCNKLESTFNQTISATEAPAPGDDFLHRFAQYAYDGLFIEVITSDKDLKYHLFGTQFRWLEWGDKFKIPQTKAFITIEADHRGKSIGYRESVKMYLTFGIDDAVQDIIDWLYSKIAGRADSLLIEGQLVNVDRQEMSRYIRKKTFLQIAAGDTTAQG